MKKYNVAVFVPHAGCPHQCSFCNQKSISGKSIEPTAEDVRNAAETAIRTAGSTDGEIAFFGGSFTAIEQKYMIYLLSAAKPYIDKKCFKGIRVSTRPDAISDEICEILKEYGVTAVELGCQSMDNEVLEKNRRGHTAEDVEKAVNMLKKYGFETGLQMMTGLYFSDREKDLQTAEKIILLKPDTVRVYPTVVLENTELCRLYRSGEYKPMSIDETVSLCAVLLKRFDEENINVIRVGLHSGGNVEEGYVAGAYHPAFKELCETEIYFQKIEEELKNKKIDAGKIVVTVAKNAISPAVGHKRKNVSALKNMGYEPVFVGDSKMKKYAVKILCAGEE